MPPPAHELALLLHPLVPESIQHNTRILSNLRSIAGLLLGIAAGILGLESLNGFLFYFVSMSFISALVHFSLADGKPNRYFPGNNNSTNREKDSGAWRDVWLGGGLFTEALSGFVLGWAGVGGVIR